MNDLIGLFLIMFSFMFIGALIIFTYMAENNKSGLNKLIDGMVDKRLTESKKIRA